MSLVGEVFAQIGCYCRMIWQCSTNLLVISQNAWPSSVFKRPPHAFSLGLKSVNCGGKSMMMCSLWVRLSLCQSCVHCSLRSLKSSHDLMIRKNGPLCLEKNTWLLTTLDTWIFSLFPDLRDNIKDVQSDIRFMEHTVYITGSQSIQVVGL